MLLYTCQVDAEQAVVTFCEKRLKAQCHKLNRERLFAKIRVFSMRTESRVNNSLATGCSGDSATLE